MAQPLSLPGVVRLSLRKPSRGSCRNIAHFLLGAFFTFQLLLLDAFSVTVIALHSAGLRGFPTQEFRGGCKSCLGCVFSSLAAE